MFEMAAFQTWISFNSLIIKVKLELKNDKSIVAGLTPTLSISS